MVSTSFKAAGLPVRVIDAQLTVTTETGTRTTDYRLVTTMLDHHQAPVRTLLRLYHERWEIETAYCELKSRILTGKVLRGKQPAAATQEMWTCSSVIRSCGPQ